jgi:hypothetical protein
MKFILLVMLSGTATWGQQSAWSGSFNSQGSMLTPAVVGGRSVALPDPALLNWQTDISHTPSPGPVMTIGNGNTGICAPSGCAFVVSQLQTAVNSLSCGQTLEMQNTVYPIVNLTFAKTCDSAHWITIERDMTDTRFAPEGTRVDPCYAGIPQSAMPYHPYPAADSTPNTCARHMPYLQKSNSASKILITGQYIRFLGIQWGRSTNYDLDTGLITLLNNGSCTGANTACMNAQAQHIIFDRNIFQGDAQRQTTRALTLSGRNIAVLDSDIYDIQLSFAGGGGDAQAWAGGFGQFVTNVGDWKFDNNLASASSMGNLFCGAFTEPLSPTTGFDGNPHDVWQTHEWFWKNPLMDTQIGQTQGTAVSIEGQSYGPAPDQEFTQVPSAIQLAVNQTYRVTTWTANDSNAGTNRSPAGTNTLTCGGGICGTVATVFDGDASTGIHKSVNAFISTYTAPTSVPPAPVTYTRCFATQDGRSSTLGHSRQLCASTVFTIVAASPVKQIVVGPSAPDLKIQPSYSDAYGNVRNFCLQFYAIPNFTSSVNTWDVDGVVGGNATVGTVDSIGLYCSPKSTGAHTIHAIAVDSTVGSSIITVSNCAPIVAFDGRAFTSKNCWELKCGKNILLENSVLENAWGSQANGGFQLANVLLMQAVNQNSQKTDGSGNLVGYGPQVIQDVTIRNIVARHAGKAMTLAGHASSPGTLGLHRVSISNFLFDDVSDLNWGHGVSSIFPTASFQGNGNSSQADNGWTSATNPYADNIFVTHGTLIGHSTSAFGITNNLRTTANSVTTGQFAGINLTLQNNLWTAPGSKTFINPTGDAGDCNTASGTGSSNTETVGLSLCFVPHTFDHVALLDSTASIANFLNPTLIWPIASTAVGFVNYNGGTGGDYRLCKGPNNPSPSCSAASPFAAGQANQASDGTDLGADISGLNAMENAVRAGVRTP